MFQNLSLLAAQEVHDSIRSATPCIVMKNDGVLYHQVSSFSPEKESAVVGRVNSQPWRTITSSMSYATMNITILWRAHFLWKRRTGIPLLI